MPFLSALKGDRIIWAVIVLLACISVVGVFSFTSSLAYKLDRNSGYYLAKQLSVLVVGLLIIFFVHRVNYTKFARLSTLLFYISLPLLLYTLFFGAEFNNGSRWIRLPVVNLTFQTSDFAKLALFMYLAKSLSQRQGNIKDFKKGFLNVLWPVAFTCMLIAPANLSTALMLGATCCILFFIGRVRVRHIFLLAIAGIMAMALLFTVSKLTGWGRAETWEQRIEDFLGSKKDDGKKSEVFQVQQAKIAIANGGFFGRGPGHSLQRDYLPEAYSDFIFSSIIEEYGLLGGSFLILLYLIFLWRSILIFRRCPYAFGAFLAVGLSVTLVFQAMLNMAVNVHLVPVTGLTLPMVSMGGSSIWFTSIAIGIILSVSRYVDDMEGLGTKKQKPARRGKKGSSEGADAGHEERPLEESSASAPLPIAKTQQPAIA
ncbi:MAG: FtsW/RodA/SpoVE family cell cycle protein [Bacteroidetes bacterium]|nr:FtsW/RodA/SpoVE family cell cycle protein [Bacteroidota bacterium]